MNFDDIHATHMAIESKLSLIQNCKLISFLWMHSIFFYCSFFNVPNEHEHHYILPLIYREAFVDIQYLLRIPYWACHLLYDEYIIIIIIIIFIDKYIYVRYNCKYDKYIFLSIIIENKN